ncbi:VOC family protein [Variovorax humicola]|uniref:VOC family protein n=1 Tax=Variovorax humicola TaxID=1769758 RepID=A0ABU8W6L7_9BURK
MSNAISWFEIPVADMDRAQRFYETVLGRTLRREDFGGQILAVFPYDNPATGGCLQAGANVSAAAGSGIRIYLDCMPSLDAVLARIENAGGKIVSPKMALPPGMGFIAHLRDTEGNEVGLHALA